MHRIIEKKNLGLHFEAVTRLKTTKDIYMYKLCPESSPKVRGTEGDK